MVLAARSLGLAEGRRTEAAALAPVIDGFRSLPAPMIQVAPGPDLRSLICSPKEPLCCSPLDNG